MLTEVRVVGHYFPVFLLTLNAVVSYCIIHSTLNRFMLHRSV